MNTARSSVIEALDLAKAGDLSRARRQLQKMRKQPDLEAEAYYGLGLVEWCQNNSDYAEAYFRKATLLDPGHADAYYQLAKISNSRGDPVMATLYLKSALAQKPAHGLAAEALAEHDVVRQAAAISDRAARI